MSSNTCGCCKPVSPLVPVRADNRPGLSAVAYRTGTYASFRETALDAIAQIPELAALRTRLDDDYAITLLNLWAIVADIITFYQERIANEGFLGTARLRDSILRLTRLIDYHLRPGIAATSLLAFTLEPNTTVHLPIGVQVQSVPAADEKPQKYETLEAIAANASWNQLRILPALLHRQPLAAGSMQDWVKPQPENLAAALALSAGDSLLFSSISTSAVEEVTVEEIVVQADRVLLRWERPLQSTWDSTVNVYKLKRKLRVFGNNAPPTYSKPILDAANSNNIIGWTIGSTDYSYPNSGGGYLTLQLDGKYDDIKEGAQFVVTEQSAVWTAKVAFTPTQQQVSIPPVSAADPIPALADTVTVLKCTASATTLAHRQDVLIYELEGEPITFWEYTLPHTLDGTSVYLSGRRTGGSSIEVDRAISGGAFQAGVQLSLKDIAPGRRLLLADSNQQPVSAAIATATISGSEIVIAATEADPTSASQLGLSSDEAETFVGVASKITESFQPPSKAKPELLVTVGEIGPRKLTLTAPITDYTSTAQALQAALRAADPSPLFTQALAMAAGNRLLVLPGVSGNDISFKATANDNTSVSEFGLAPDQVQFIDVLFSAPLQEPLAVTNAAPQLRATIGTITKVIDFSSAPTLQATAYSLTLALLLAGFVNKASLFEQSRVQAVGNRLMIVSGAIAGPVDEYLRLDLSLLPGEALDLDPVTAFLLGNVAEASHGETIKAEVLGDGNMALAFQNFALKKNPVTYIPSATPGGTASSLAVSINGVQWQEAPTLFGYGASDQIFITRIADDGTLTAQFGDGITGARIPTGKSNIVANYRQGSGLAGRVRANTLRTLLTRPAGLKAVSNPLAADGGADPEHVDQARQNAPSTCRTFGRAISLLDFEDLVASSGEVAKAQSTWVWNGEAKTIHLTVAGQQGGTFSADALATIHASLDSERDPNYPLLLGNFVRVPIVISASLGVDPARDLADVEAAARQTLLDALSFDHLGFGQPIHESLIYTVLQSVSGVVWVDLTLLQFKDQSAGNLALRLATSAPVQPHLRIFSARINPSAPPAVLPAEQALIEIPSHDFKLSTQVA